VDDAPKPASLDPVCGEPDCAHDGPAHIRRAGLLKRVFDIDLELCLNSDGEPKIITAIASRRMQRV
jgi:hypothetical protein